MTSQMLFDGIPDLKVSDTKVCVKCGAETRGFRRRGPGHPTIPYCRVCFYPKRFAYCGCKRVKSARAATCMVCLDIGRLEKKIAKLEGKKATLKQVAKIKAARERLEFLRKSSG